MEKMNKPDLENDLKNTHWIVNQCEYSEAYSQQLYASLCNRIFMKDGEEWACTWRHAAGIVAELRSRRFKENYMDWYCSGIWQEDEKFTGYIHEGEITETIEKDLFKLGWTHRSYE